MKALFSFFCAVFTSCAVLQNNAQLSQWRKAAGDTAFVYSLPFAKGTRHRVMQGYHSAFSHWDDIAVDFKMKKGTRVCATRSGVVVFVKQDEVKGGIGKRYVGRANRITIQHSDDTYGHYLHLQHNGALVNVGDTVQQGQVIGLSGSTGFSAFPHLHFEVTKGLQKAKEQLPVRFHTQKGAIFLMPLKQYKAI